MSEHVSGFPAGDGTHRCRTCAWADGTPARCVAAPGDGPRPLVDDAEACAFWEPPVQCGTCGACCREAFDSVPVGPADEHTARRHPALVVHHPDGWRDLARVPTPRGTRCVALRGDGCEAPYRCAIYADRPQNCVELEPGSPNCLLARRRVGIAVPSA